MSTCASARLPSTRILAVCTPHLPTSEMTGWDSKAASWRLLALPRSIMNLRTWRFTPWVLALPGASELGDHGSTRLPAESTFSLRRPRALTASPFSLAVALTFPSNHSYHSASNPTTCARSSTPPARTVFNSAPASCSISSSLLNRVHAAISSEGRDLSLFLLEQIFSSLLQPLQSSPTLSNTPPPSPAAPAHIPPKPHRVSAAHSASHPQNSTLHTRTLPLLPTIPHISAASASPLPPPSHARQNSHIQTPAAAL